MEDLFGLLTTLDVTMAFPDTVNSTVKKTGQVYDEMTGEYVVTFEYRAKVSTGQRESREPLPLLAELNRRIGR